MSLQKKKGQKVILSRLFIYACTQQTLKKKKRNNPKTKLKQSWKKKTCSENELKLTENK